MKGESRNARRVARGIARLDDRIPGWRSGVNARRLVMSSPVNCVLGQVTGSYELGTAKLDLGRFQAIFYGFDVFGISTSSRRVTAGAMRRHTALEREWRRQLLQDDLDQELADLCRSYSYLHA
jgi:hypothetical protein